MSVRPSAGLRGRHASAHGRSARGNGALMRLQSALQATLLPWAEDPAAEPVIRTERTPAQAPAPAPVAVAAVPAARQTSAPPADFAPPAPEDFAPPSEPSAREQQLLAEIAALEASRDDLRAATGAGTTAEIPALVDELRAHLTVLVKDAHQHLARRTELLAEHERHVG